MSKPMPATVTAKAPAKAKPAKKAKPTARAEETWTCPMHPEIHLHHGGKCPKCGMDLVKESKAVDKK